MLLFARALDGVQGAATGTASMAIILELFSRQDRVKALGWWSLVGAGGPVLGVTLGSPVIQFFGWRTLFWGQLVLLVIASVVVALLLPSHRRCVASRRVDGVSADGATADGATLDRATADGQTPTGRRRRRRCGAPGDLGRHGLGGDLEPGRIRHGRHAGAEHRPDRGLDVTGRDHLAVSLAIVLTVVFVRRELTFATPLIPTTYWRRRNFMFPMGTKAFSSFAYFGGFFLFPLLMEQVYGYSVSQVGFISVARPLLFAISAPIAGYMTVRTGERTATLFGAGSLLLSMILFATLSASAGLGDHPGRAGALGPRHGRVHPGDVGDHVQRAGRVGVRRHERRAAAGDPGRRSGRDPGRPDHSGVDRPRSGLGNVHHSTGAPAQLQRPVLGRRRRGRAGRCLRAVHPVDAPRGAGGTAAGRRGLSRRRPTSRLGHRPLRPIR